MNRSLLRFQPFSFNYFCFTIFFFFSLNYLFLLTIIFPIFASTTISLNTFPGLPNDLKMTFRVSSHFLLFLPSIHFPSLDLNGLYPTLLALRNLLFQTSSCFIFSLILLLSFPPNQHSQRSWCTIFPLSLSFLPQIIQFLTNSSFSDTDPSFPPKPCIFLFFSNTTK